MGYEFLLLDSLQRIHTPLLDRGMVFLTELGNKGMVWILLAVLLFLGVRTRRLGMVVLAALLLDIVLCNGILKNAVARVRPCDVNPSIRLLIPRPSDFSFPSGHTAAAFSAVSALYFAGAGRKLLFPAAALASGIAFSRLYLYVHYPTDILGGILLGVLCGYLAERMAQRLEREAVPVPGSRIRRAE